MSLPKGAAMRLRARLAVVLACGSLLAHAAHATDQPLDAVRLVLKRRDGREKLLFVSRDPRVLFPVVGSADDPATGTPGGATIELFSHSEGSAALSVPAGAGKPGWKVASDRYTFTNPKAPAGPSPVEVLVLRQAKGLKVIARAAGLPLSGAQGSVGIRVSTGELRNCALFDAPTIRRDEVGRFVAQGAAATSLGDCSDAALAGLTCSDTPFPTCDGPCLAGSVCGPTAGLDACRCISSAEPCGETAPVCNGECPAGEECATFQGYPLPTCACLPAGSTPCGGAFPSCGGACPGSQVCRLVSLPSPPPIGGETCLCTNPGPCDSSCGGADCPSGFFCAVIPQQGCTCAPINCSGGAPFPVCGGTCSPGSSCQPVAVPQYGLGFCVCGDPALACDAACSGSACPPGEVCNVDTQAQSCSCAPPPP
jgi:hypothetical protein